jgi:hypothetical protein
MHAHMCNPARICSKMIVCIALPDCFACLGCLALPGSPLSCLNSCLPVQVCLVVCVPASLAACESLRMSALYCVIFSCALAVLSCLTIRVPT